MKPEQMTYGTEDVVRPGRGTAGVVMALLILLGALLNACRDQPVDGTGITVIRDTIRVSRDSVIIRDSIVYNDSVVIRDSIIYRDSIILKDTLIVRDTTVIRDSVRYRDSVVYDTIDVPGTGNPYRSAMLTFQARSDTGNLTQSVQVDLTDYLQYTVVGSGDTVQALSLSMSAAMPPQFSRLIVRDLQDAVPFYLKGLALNVPSFRLGLNAGAEETVQLNRHPYNWLPTQDKSGGIMITAQAGQLASLFQGWTGQVIEAGGSTGGERYQSEGQLVLSRINISGRRMNVYMQATLYVAVEISGKQVVERFVLTLECELGY